MVINTNVTAQTTARYLDQSNALLNKSLARLSSGSKIVSPEDDAGGLAVSMRFDAQINRLGAVQDTVANAVSFSQTQDGFLAQVAKVLDRMSELAIQAQDPLKSPTDRALYGQEYASLQAHLANIATKDFNGVSLFNGLTINVPMDSEGNTFAMSTPNLATGTLNNIATNPGINISDPAQAGNALNWIKAGLVALGSYRATVGANISRLTMVGDQLSVMQDNLTAANSRIKDVDVAEESTQFAKYNILVQAGTAMLAQANATPQTALRLLQ